jgi:hypothetical protein
MNISEILLQDKKVYLIECTQHISIITFILYAQSQKIRKLHNIKKTNSTCAFVDIGGIVDIFFSYKEQSISTFAVQICYTNTFLLYSY